MPILDSNYPTLPYIVLVNNMFARAKTFPEGGETQNRKMRTAKGKGDLTFFCELNVKFTVYELPTTTNNLPYYKTIPRGAKDHDYPRGSGGGVFRPII